MLAISEQDYVNQCKLLEEKSMQKSTLFFDNFVKSLTPVYKDVELPDFVKIPKDVPYLLRGDFEPKYTIDLRKYKESLYYNKSFPMWRNQSNREFSLHGYGLIDNDRTKPSKVELYDTSPHKFLVGATGHGKSVLLNSLIVSAALVHPPWKVQYFLNDPKILEFKPYAIAKKIMPHINVVAATTDPGYTISMLEYLIDVMNRRNDIFVKAGAKSIDSFNKNTGLCMPMLVIILDEVRAMYLNASRKKTYIDTLIAKFVALARNAGGRAILASQDPVDEMSATIMKNINTRASMGCQSAVSIKAIGNPAASRYQGQKGKVVVNQNPGAEDIKDNVYLVSPFIPDFPTNESKRIEEIFEDLFDIADLIGFDRQEPVSFFDEEEPLTKEEFMETVIANASLKRFFLGEPAFIYKEDFKLYNISMIVISDYDTNEAMNFLAMSPLAFMRFNMAAALLANTAQLKNAKTLLRTPIKAITDKVKNLGFPITDSIETTDISEQLFRDMVSIYIRYIIVAADDRVFGHTQSDDTIYHQKLIEEYAPQTDVEKQRLFHIFDICLEARSKLVLKLPDLTDETFSMYLDCINVILPQYNIMNAENRKVEPIDFSPVFFIYFDFDKIKGVEIRPQTSVVEQIFDIIKIGPLYNIYTFVITGVLPNAAGSIWSAFSNLLFYAVPENFLNAFRIRDEYPETVSDRMWVYVNKKIPTNYCFKLKFPDLTGQYVLTDQTEEG